MMNLRIILVIFFFGGQTAFAQQTDSLQIIQKHPKNQYLKGAIVPP